MVASILSQLSPQCRQEGMAAAFGHYSAPHDPAFLTDLLPSGEPQEAVDTFDIASRHEHRGYYSCFDKRIFALAHEREPVGVAIVHALPPNSLGERLQRGKVNASSINSKPVKMQRFQCSNNREPA